MSKMLPFVKFHSFSVSTERLYNSNGRDLRRALFSLKQIFQVTTHTHTYFIEFVVTVCCSRLQLVIVATVHFHDDRWGSPSTWHFSLCIYLCGDA